MYNEPVPRFTISIAVWNNLIFTKPCLESIKKAGGDYEILVTNNASWDGTKEWLDSVGDSFGPLKVIHNSENLGFILAHNRALPHAKGEFFIVLNNDTEVPPGWLDSIEAEFKKPKVAVVGANGQCKSLNSQGVGFHGPTLDYIEGSCLTVRTEMARKHGLFDEAYTFGYYEDSDLSLRYRELGYELSVASFKLAHRGAATSNLAKEKGIDIEGFKLRNSYVFRERWKNYLERRAFAGRILMKRMAAMGDALMATPVLRAIKRKNPACKITMVTGFPEIFRMNPHLSDLGTQSSTPESSYDRVLNLDLVYERSPKIHMVSAYAKACDIEVDDYRPEIFPTVEEERWAQACVPKGKPFVAIHTGTTAWVGRNWAPERFQRVADYWKSKGYAIVLVGNRLTPPITCDLDMREKTTVHSLASVLKLSSLFIGIDSLPMHIAASQDRPIAAVFGCISPEFRLPPGLPYMRGVTAGSIEVGCLGCHHWLPAPRVSTGCLRDKVYCMEKLTHDQVISESEVALSKYPRR